MSKQRDWLSLQQLFITDPERPTPGKFAGKHGIPPKTLQNRASREGWLEKRREHWERVGKKTGEKLAELQATIHARDIASQLEYLARIKMRAFDAALTGEYPDPGSAVLAIERITKLERLLLGEATETISLSDMRSAIRKLMEALRRMLGDEVLASLGDAFEEALGERPDGSPDKPENPRA
ncbi:MAG: hypothetical protein SFU83_06375 [Meiothermus sp.]|nr:hypothetical protein [Meiothermus sp.]